MATSKSGVSDSSATISDDSATETDSEIHNFNNRDTPSPSDSTLFSVGDMVLASHKGLFYEAKAHSLSSLSLSLSPSPEFIVFGLRNFKNEAKFWLILEFSSPLMLCNAASWLQRGMSSDNSFNYA